MLCAALIIYTTGCGPNTSTGPSNAEAIGTPPIESAAANQILASRAQELLIEGQKAFQMGQYEQAMAYLDSAETEAPDAPVVPFNRGRVYTALNDVVGAQHAFKEALNRDPGYPEVRLRLGDIELQRGELDEALAYYRIEASIEPTSALFVKMGEAYSRLGKADSAQISYEKAIADDSLSANAHMMYGQLLEELGLLDKALEHSKQALAIEPNQTNYQFAVGSQLYQSGQLEDAIVYLKSAADGRLLHYPAQYNLGQTFMRLGREAEAKHYLARADSARELMDQITNTQSIAAQNPNSVDDWIKLGELFRRAGERDRAVQAFNRASALDPQNIRVQKNVGEMMLAEGDVRGAVSRFQSILKVDEDQPDVWKNLGLAFAVAGLCEEARQSLQVALRYRPNDDTLKEVMAGVCAGQ